MKHSILRAQLIKHEGTKRNAAGRHIVYTDTVGKRTIGYGRNVDDVGLSEAEALEMLDNDITERFNELRGRIDCFGSLDDTRQHVLIDMSFMGVDKLLKFSKMLAALEARNFDKAADEMLESRWASQVGKRAQTLAKLMRSGL